VRLRLDSSNKTSIWRVNSDGSNAKQLTNGMADIAPECSQDGKWLYYQDYMQNLQIMRVPIDGGTPEVVTAIMGPELLGKLDSVSLLTAGWSPSPL